jgi:hypothetical protein
MRRPWFEAGPALAAAGHAPPPPPIGGAATPAPGCIWTLPMIHDADFAFLTRINATTKPTVCADLHGLARHIERRRLALGGDRAIQLEEVEDLQFANRPGLHRGVQVWLLDMAHERETSLGYAWLKGEGRDRLEPALRTARRDLAASPSLGQVITAHCAPRVPA